MNKSQGGSEEAFSGNRSRTCLGVEMGVLFVSLEKVAGAGDRRPHALRSVDLPGQRRRIRKGDRVARGL